ncbi:MAG TPA: phytanoyl-CoA dioxygenase family protein [Chthonomonadaceae bacterium]|nr:phytanoyl-CoA dioxygenase family protein [Chthonomonadaceae bacterium]
MNGDLERNGFAIAPDVMDESTITELLEEFAWRAGDAEGAAGHGLYALRNLLQAVPAVCELAASQAVRTLVEPFLGRDCFAVRAIYFDKMPDANWKVPWHQDLSIAVAERRDVEGFGHWSQKAGVAHAQAPASLLERMLTVRLHLDRCDRTNGPLRVLPGTHRYGKLKPGEIERLRAEVPETVCEVERGGAMLMRPLLLHASSSAQSAHHRRVIHIEYAAEPLPDVLAWYETVPGSS